MTEFPGEASIRSTARLVVEQGPAPDDVFSLTAPVMVIGRAAGNEIMINDPEISRQHAQIVQQGDAFAVEDLGSTNGTFVNGQRCLGRTVLHHGDQIDFGDTVRVRFFQAGAAEQETVYDPGFGIMEEPARPSFQRPAYPTDTAVEASDAVPVPVPSTNRNRNIAIGVGCGLLLTCVICAGSLYALDAYDQGRLLYCGFLRPFWEVILGFFGFAPICP